MAERRPWVIVAGDFVRTGGMDAANHALALYLARSGRETHVVAHRIADDLAAEPNVLFQPVRRPFGKHSLGFPLLDRTGRRVAAVLAARDPIVVANGGNCAAGNVVWLHYVHAAYEPVIAGRRMTGWWHAAARRAALADEARVTAKADLVIANSGLTARHAVDLLGAAEDRVHVVHYGADPDRMRPPTAEERTEARRALGWTDGRPVVAFIGALGDRRKGFDTLFAAWTRLAADPAWDARLAVAGTGGELEAWRARAADAGLADRIVFLGFQADVRTLLWAADAIASPTRYEAYGLAVQEALCCGLPALVSRAAGVAERIPAPLDGLLLADPDDAAELAGKLRGWREGMDGHRKAALALSARMRAWTWDHMAERIVEWAE
ncbi:glycosyltransferase family 4 protein [Longimicrobium terrae]|uniref:Glycosyltransferase involved in cell wall biosynthesis n=1 Tax=Longimicrobium terrae TaxID=1639882 RepID=A0A841H5J2_9BACT|nr:glycosyltransferase family 4 protein [Longimicrobium terrae]MBB4638994.1 glycosyltransferase involved in cell wall biosynthesis [Longimicrobium terrae]MBB6073233.1 glycosyltransferase involved in cell wall biosynthesis [Longimicrobium terrae]